MEAWEIKIITTNLEKLAINTSCTSNFLNKFHESKILSEEDVEQLSLPGENSAAKSTKFYRKIVTRKNGFTKLMDILKETNQTEARNILKTAIAKWRHTILNEVNSVSYDANGILGKGSNEAVLFKGKFAGRDVAVKRVNSGSKQEKMVIKEIENLKKCDSQENIIRYYGTTIVDNFILIVLELCEISLKDWLPEKPLRISPTEILRQVTVGLKWLHFKRIVHRDLKPGNILLTSSESIRAKISDFGLSRKIEGERNYILSCGLGTQGWIAPEILIQFDENYSGKYKFTFESDIFSLGCVFYYVLTNGKHPFGGQVMRNANILIGKHETDPKSLSCVTGENVKIITLMISKDVKLRPSCLILLSSSIFFNHEDESKKRVENGGMNEVKPIVKLENSNPAESLAFSSLNNSHQLPSISSQNINGRSTVEHSPRVLEITQGWNDMHMKNKVKVLFKIMNKESLSTIKEVFEGFTDNINVIKLSKYGNTLLHNAIVCRHLKIVEYLLKQFSNKLQKAMFANLISQSLLVHNTCVSSDEEFENKSKILNLIIGMRPDFVNSDTKILNNALYEAPRICTIGKHAEFFRILLEHNADSNAADEAGETPLFYATKFFGKTPNYLGIVKILMEYQADPNIKNKRGETFLHLACAYASPENFHGLIIYLVSIQKTEVFKSACANGYTLLHYFVMEKQEQYETLKVLVLNGSDPNAVNMYGNSVLFTAISFDASETFLEKLIGLGANWKFITKNGTTAIHCAAFSKNMSAVKLLVRLGCDDFNLKDINGNTPLHAALFHNFPIFQCHIERKLKIVPELISFGAKVNIKNNEGLLPVDLFRRHFYIEKTPTLVWILELLMDYDDEI